MAYNSNIHHRRSVRLQGYDYSQAGLYFITICCDGRICRFGEIVGANGIRPEMKLNEFGTIAFDEWTKTPQLRPNVELGEFVIMPNHIHGIIHLLGRGELHSPKLHSPKLHSPKLHSPKLHSPKLHSPKLHSPKLHSPENKMPDIVDRENIGRGELHSPELHSTLRGPSQTIGAIVRGYKSSVTKQLGLMGFDEKLWQRNYHEHIIRNEQSYQTIANYIINNPAKWQEDKFYTI